MVPGKPPFDLDQPANPSPPDRVYRSSRRAISGLSTCPTPYPAFVHTNPAVLFPARSYVGALHEINSEQSTVSLENVRSYGTEGRKGRPEEEIGPSDQVYEYIIFRGSDVKDLRIEEPAAKEAKPAVPSDPAILGVSFFLCDRLILAFPMMNYSGCKTLLSTTECATLC